MSHKQLQFCLSQFKLRQRTRFGLIHGSLACHDCRLASFNAASLVEVIEHFDLYRFGARPRHHS